MRVSALRLTSCLIALALGAAVGIGSASATTPAPSSDPAAVAVLRQAQAMVRPVASGSALARPTTGSAPTVVRPKDGTATMLELRKVLPRLSGADQAAALALLTPTKPCTGTNGQPDGAAYQTASDPDGLFEIHYTTSGPNAVTDAYLASVESTLDNVYAHEITTFGYQPPLTPAASTSGWWTGGTQIPIALCNIEPDLYGYCAPVGSSPTWSFPAACTLRNNYATRTVNGVTYAYYNSKFDGSDTAAPLKVTAAHEFFHAVQFRQDANEPLWLMEGSAVWMENEVYPQIHDYLQYLPYSGIKRPLVPFNSSSTYTPYGDFALFKTLAGYFHGRDVVRQIWSYLGQHQSTSALAALIAVAKAHNRSLTSVLLTYAIWNTLAPHGYPSANLYRPAVWWLNPRLDRENRTLASHRVSVHPMADATIAIVRGSHVVSTTRLRINVSGPGWFTVRRQLSNGSTVTSQYRIGSAGSTLTIPFNTSVTYVAITLNNVATTGSSKYFGIRATVL